MLKRLFQIGTIMILAAGCKSFKVDVGALSAPSSATPPIPVVVPTVNVTVGVPGISKSKSATVAFTTTAGTYAIQSTRCQLDFNPAVSCSNTFSVGKLYEGSHTIVISVSDVQGNRSDATMNWVVNLSVPTIDWVSTLPATITTNSVTLDFTTSANATNKQCSLNGTTPIGCLDTITYGGFFPGLNFVRVSATDQLGHDRERYAPFFMKPMTARTVPVAACMEITLPGLYQVTGNITGASSTNGANCINIHDTANVVFDCQGRTITAWNAIRVTSVNNFTIQNCTIRNPGLGSGAGFYGDPMLGATGSQQTIAISDSTQGNLDNNIIGEIASDVNYTVLLKNSVRVLLQNNVFNSMVHLSYSSDNILFNNEINCPRMSNSPGSGRCAGVVVLGVKSNNNKILENVIDGRVSDLAITDGGTDDGIVVFETEGNLIASNTIRNAFDLGIETYGSNKTLTVVDNTLTDVGNGGIGGRWWLGLTDSKFLRNVADGTPTIFNFRRHCGLRTGPTDSLGLLTADTGIYFENNQFESNSLTNQLAGTPAGFQIFDSVLLDQSATCGTVTAVTASDFHLSTNTFLNNDFSETLQTYFGPATSTNVIDGGGNSCTGSTSPIFCWDSFNSSGI
jgi:hypothetical protein